MAPVRTHKDKLWTVFSTTDCFGQRRIVYNFLRVPVSSVMCRKPYWMCCSYSSVLFPSCCLRIAAHRVCFVEIEVTVIWILCRVILSDNCQPTQPTTLTRGGVLVVNDDSCRTNKGPLQTRCNSLQKMCGYFWVCLLSVFRLPSQNTARGDHWLRHICPSSRLFAWKYTNIWRLC